MRFFLLLCLLLVAFWQSATGAPLPANQKDPAPQETKSAFGVAFDEIVVESSLTVVPRKNNARQAKSKSLNLSGNGKTV